MKSYAIALMLVLTALTGFSQPGKTLSISEEKGEQIRRVLLQVPVLLEENANYEAQVSGLRAESDSLRSAVQSWQQAAGAQEAAAGLRAQQLEACQHLALETEKTNRAKLWKTRAIAAGGWLVAAVFGYLAVSN